MKKFHKLVALLMIFGLFSACSSSDDDNPATITISKSDYTVGAEQDSEAVATFSVNVDWKTSIITYVGETKDWLTVTPDGKAGTDKTITVKAAANPTEVERKASFNINYGNKEHKLTITQTGKALEPTITISKSDYTVGAEQNSEVVATFSVNVDWETSVITYVGETKDWLTITPIDGKAGTDKVITMKVAANPAKVERTASFNINYGNKEHKLTITQENEGDITSYFDVNFAVKLQERGYITDATKIFSSDVKNITTVDISETMALGEITSLSGIEYFEELTTLSCGVNIINSIDLSKNTKLTTLDCEMNKIVTLDLSKNTELTTLNCKNNLISSLNVSNSKALTKLLITKNKTISLDLSNNTALEILYCESNLLENLDLRKNINLKVLACQSNKLESLDLSKNIDLTELICQSNKLERLDLSKNIALISLNCFGNQINDLDVSGSKALTKLLCNNNLLTSLNLTNNTALTGLTCGNNLLTSLDLRTNIEVYFLSCGMNEIEAMDVRDNINLEQFFCYGNKLKVLDVSKNTKLTGLFCYTNQLEALDVSKNIVLGDLNCRNNLLASLDISMHETFLRKLDCKDNPGVANKFIVKSWFDNSGILYNFTKDPWIFNGTNVDIEYQKVM